MPAAIRIGRVLASWHGKVSVWITPHPMPLGDLTDADLKRFSGYGLETGWIDTNHELKVGTPVEVRFADAGCCRSISVDLFV